MNLSLSPVNSVAALDRMFEPFARCDAPGLIVGIAGKDGFTYRRGFGLADAQQGAANTATTRMRIASITKQFTCLALMLLAEDGKLDIDAPVGRYLPELAAPLAAATPRQLMTHTSGYRCTLEMGTIANGTAPQPRDWQPRALARQTTLQFLSGEEQLYCNGSYAALTDVIERQSGQGYAAFLRERIFLPLGMFDSEVVEDDRTLVPGMASAHVRNGSGWQRPPVDSDMRGDGGMVSSIDDMLRWLAHLRGAKLVGSEATWRALLEPCRLTRGFATTYAMGIKRHDYRGVEVIQHSGGLFGLNAQIMTVPAHGIDIAILVNGAPASATRLAYAALDLVMGERFAQPAPVRARSTDHADLMGRNFSLPSGLLLSFADAGGALGLSQMHMMPAPVISEDDTSLFVAFEEIGFGPLVWRKEDLAAFRADPAQGLPVTIAGESHCLETLPPPTGEIASGTYASPELDARAVISIEDGVPVLRMKGDYSAERQFSIEPLSPRHWGLVSHDGEERYAIEIDDSGFWLNTHRARRIRFDQVEALAA